MKRLFLSLCLCAMCAVCGVESYAADGMSVVVVEQRPKGLEATCDDYMSKIMVSAISGDEAEVARATEEMMAWVETLPVSDQAFVIGKFEELVELVGFNPNVSNAAELDRVIDNLLNRYTEAYLKGDSAKADAVMAEMQQWIATLDANEVAYVVNRSSEMMRNVVAVDEDLKSRQSLGREAIVERMDDYMVRMMGNPSQMDAIGEEMQAWIATLSPDDSAIAIQYAMSIMNTFGGDNSAVSDARKEVISDRISNYMSEVAVATMSGNQSRMAEIQRELETWLTSLTPAELTYALEVIQRFTQMAQ